MSTPRAFVLGILTAFSAVFALFSASRLLGEQALLLLLLPGLGLVVAGLLEAGRPAQGSRVLRAGLGIAAAGAAAFELIGWLAQHGRIELGDPLAGYVLVALAGACGGMTAMARSPRRGLALTLGYIAGFVVLMLPPAFAGDEQALAFVGLFALILGVGALVGRVLRALLP